VAGVAPNISAITMRLAACVYFADCEAQNLPSVLFDMLPASKQMWYFRQAAKVLKYAAAKKEPLRPEPKFVRRSPRDGETRGGRRSRT
jgi:hypothetical protein